MKNLRIIFKYIWPYKRLVSAYFSFNILSSVFSVLSLGLLSPFLLLLFKKEDALKSLGSGSGSLSHLNPVNALKGWLYDLINQPNGDIKALGIICIIVLLSVILKNLFLYLSMYYLTPIRTNILNDMRKRMFRKILELPIGYFNDQRKGDLMSKMTNDLGQIEGSTISVLETTFREPFAILFFLIYMIVLSPQLTLFLVVFLPVAGLIIGRIGRSLKRQSTQVLERLGTILSTIDETLGGIRIIKAFNAEKKQFNRFEDENKQLFHIVNAANRRRDMASPVSEVLGVTVVVCVLWYGGRLVLRGSFLNPGDFLAYIALITQLIQPLKALSSASFNLRNGAASIERVEALIAQDIRIKEIENPVQITSFENAIEFRNVSFKYDEITILKNINLKVKKGQTVALVGSSGAGKSTLADLVPRFHDISGGELLIDGKSIKDYSLKSLRSLMGIVTQEPILFNDTIENNIMLGADYTDHQKVEAAAKVANAYNYISQKEGGFNSNIGDRGGKLSGGERQRLTIARAVYKNPPILILDEATSSLDTESERLVQDAINNLMQDRTSIVIAHRLSTVRHADEIIVLQKGEIVERGTHDELIAQQGYYKKLVDMQEVS